MSILELGQKGLVFSLALIEFPRYIKIINAIAEWLGNVRDKNKKITHISI